MWKMQMRLCGRAGGREGWREELPFLFCTDENAVDTPYSMSAPPTVPLLVTRSFYNLEVIILPPKVKEEVQNSLSTRERKHFPPWRRSNNVLIAFLMTYCNSCCKSTRAKSAPPVWCEAVRKADFMAAAPALTG